MTCLAVWGRKLWKFAALLRVPRYRRALRYRIAATVEHERVPFLDGVRAVIDVGANRGQFAVFATERFPGASIDCFEPLPGPRRRLERWARGEPCVRVHAIALGAVVGTTTMHVARRDDSSSTLPIGAAQSANFPGTEEVGKLTAPIARLDGALASDRVARPSLLKIDVQGGELDVIEGSSALLPAIDQVLVECSFVELYAGQALAPAVIARLSAMGFALRGAYSVAYSADGACLQADLLFGR